MDSERFDRLSRVLARGATRRGVLTATMAALAGGSLFEGAETEAKRRRGRKPRGRVRAEEAINTCAKLCAFLPSAKRPVCLAFAAANPALCECPSFCHRLYGRRPLRKLACLRETADDPEESLCLACAADPDRACLQTDGSHICCAEGETCEAGACVGDSGTCAGAPCRSNDDCSSCNNACTTCTCLRSQGFCICGTITGCVNP